MQRKRELSLKHQNRYWTPVAHARVEDSTASSCSTNSIYSIIILRTSHLPRPIPTLFSIPMAQVPFSEASKASKNSKTPYPTRRGSKVPQ